MCINCGHISPAPNRPANVGLMCSDECEDQWNALVDQIKDDDQADFALYQIGSFATKWPDVTTTEFLRIVEVSQRMAAKYPTVWPFIIEYHADKGCWHFERKGAAPFH
jgi:hypothetical protein